MTTRILLRAEIVAEDGARIIAHTLELSETHSFVETDDRLPVDSIVQVQLSFPRLVSPISAVARVLDYRERSGPGDPSGMQLALSFDSDEDRGRLAALLRTMQASPSATPPPRRLHVLLVEDNHLIRDMFAYGIEKYFRGQEHGVTVDHAPDGATAWKLLDDGSYDLAIVDYYLPELDGAQLITRVRAQPRLAELPVVAVSVGGEDARAATIDAGADLFLDKPLVLKDLFATLERLNAHAAQR
ncbi:MAG TPA: response regulator [Polyangia bacterium]